MQRSSVIPSPAASLGVTAMPRWARAQPAQTLRFVPAAFDPATMRPAHWPFHAHDWLAWAGFTYPFNLSHSPAASIPAGMTPQGLPVGIQLVAPRLGDGYLLEACAQIEAVLAAERLNPAVSNPD